MSVCTGRVRRWPLFSWRRAARACGGRVSVNGKAAKPGTDIKIGDVIEVSFGEKKVKVEVTDVSETVRKDAASSMYKVL